MLECSEGEEEQEDFQTVPLNDEQWASEEIPEKHCAFMSMDYHMGYAHTNALMQTIRCLLTWTAWI